MNWTQIAEHYWVSPQISEADIEAAAEQGIEVIMCNRPDGEEMGQPVSSDIRAMVEAKNMRFEFLPMAGPSFPMDYIDTVKDLNSAATKTLAYCRSGNRSGILFNAAVNN